MGPFCPYRAPMAIARKHLVDDATPGCYHLISRCVRRGFLCGVAYAHRRDWVRNLVEGAARCFAVDVLTYAVMDNHCHLVVRTDPARVDNWSDREVAERWATAHPRRAFTAEPVAWEESEIACCAADPLWIARHRARLASLSWFMKAIKEPIAKRANREDGCTGHFWEGRFKSVRLLDQQAVVACMAYVDLNPRSAAARRRRLARSHDVGGRHDRRRHRQPRRARSSTPSPGSTDNPIPDSSANGAPFIGNDLPVGRGGVVARHCRAPESSSQHPNKAKPGSVGRVGRVRWRRRPSSAEPGPFTCMSAFSSFIQ